jgi:hypothetical protein
LGAFVLTLAAVAKVVAVSWAEYSLLLALIVISLISDAPSNPPPGWTVVANQLQVAAQGAADANMQGNRSKQIAGLGKTIGAADALMALSSSCDTCGPARADLQEVIGVAAHLKSTLVGPSGTCNPDGTIARGEECDPLANPTGCQALPFLAFCDDQCVCEVLVTSTTTTTTTTSTTSTTLI